MKKNTFKFNKHTLFHLISKVLKWVLRIYNFPYPGSTKDLFAFIDRLKSIHDSRGTKEYIPWHKAVRTACLNHLAGTPKRVPGVKQTRDGLPVVLGNLIPKMRQADPHFVRIMTTILFSTRAISIGTEPNYKPILEGPKGDLPNISMYMGQFWKEMGYFPCKNTPKSVLFKKYHLSTKACPSGPFNAIGQAMPDFKALKLNSQLYDHVKNLGGEKFSDYLFVINNELLFKGFSIDTSKSLRRLSYFPDKEDKVRVIAIGDYWSQTVLKPLHEYLFRVLKKIPQDCTFNQGKGIGNIANTGESYHSVDLTAATDRFPIEVIYQLLCARFPKDYVDSWRYIMVGTPFDTPEGKISYSVGNPMGFYSSWSSFALCHHYIIFYCCKILGKDWKSAKYVLLGDDIVIADKELATAYKNLIKELGVDYSPLKTFDSKHFFEFAKRLWFKGVEISPFPMSALQECGKKYYLLLEMFKSLENKGWIVPNGPSWAVGEYMGEILARPQRYVKAMVNKAQILHLIMEIIRGSEHAGELLTEAFRILGHHFILSDFVARNVLENIIVEKFAESNPSDRRVQKEKGYTLHKVLDQFLHPADYEELLRIDNPIAPERVLWHPVANVYSQLSEVLQEMSNKGLAISSTGGDWPLLMRTMALPWSDKIFVERSHHLIVRATAGITTSLEDRAQILGFYPPEELLRETP